MAVMRLGPTTCLSVRGIFNVERFLKRVSLLLLPSALLFAPGAFAASVTLEVQAVSASDAGKDKELKVPEALDSYKALLKQSGFKTFKDAGKQSVKASEGEKSSAKVGGYSVDLNVTKIEGGKCKVAVTIKEGEKAITSPAVGTVSRDYPMRIQVGHADAPTILIINMP
jgi:hypothetical protein